MISPKNHAGIDLNLIKLLNEEILQAVGELPEETIRQLSEGTKIADNSSYAFYDLNSNRELHFRDNPKLIYNTALSKAGENSLTVRLQLLKTVLAQDDGDGILQDSELISLIRESKNGEAVETSELNKIQENISALINDYFNPLMTNIFAYAMKNPDSKLAKLLFAQIKKEFPIIFSLCTLLKTPYPHNILGNFLLH